MLQAKTTTPAGSGSSPAATAPQGEKPLRHEAFLTSILSSPAAPFRERHVISTITAEMDRLGVPFFQDPHGNLVVGVSSKAEYLKLVREKSKEPVRVFIAHLDHPGFHGTRWRSPTELEFKFHGGGPTQHLVGAPVWIADREGWFAEGHIREAQLTKTGRSIESGVVEVPLEDRPCRKRAPKPTDLYGGFRFRAPVWQEGSIVYTKAADDLVGSFATASVAIELFARDAKKTRAKRPSKRPPFIGLLTRAEEVGFIGALAHFELGWLKQAKRPVLCVSLETSRTLPGADIGKGPVVRLGDKFGVFDARALHVFTKLARKVLPDAHQKRVMDGGTCEGTAAMCFGFPTVAISVPLGNYHNQSLEGGPDSAGPGGPAPEFVHRDDIAGLITLCHALMTPGLTWNDPFREMHEEFRKDLKKYAKLMKSGP
jgi:putative aminopeptidase FrvX